LSDYIVKIKDNFNAFDAQYMIGRPFNILDHTDSTNNHAMRMIRAGLATHGEVYFALEQIAGRGQSGRSWDSEPGKNLMISIVLQKNLPEIKQLFNISLCIVLSCLDLFNKHTNGDMSIKWPNDIFWRDRKAGGILIENVISGNTISHSIIGIGLNINQTVFPDFTRKVVSLKQITGKSYNPVELADELCNLIDQKLQSWSTQLDSMLEQYNNHLFRKNESIEFNHNNQRTLGIVKHVNSEGCLGILREKIDYFYSGEITWLL
jgi:BirA family biotin operon repressor/biotin-[acetyl-CoA-carboxylase] ligase